MLQRSPTYVAAGPDVDKIANALRKVLPEDLAYRITRWKNTKLQQFFYGRTRTQPDKVRKVLLQRVRKALPDGYDVDKHFTPTYNPWDQRLCLVPNGDLFEAITRGKASVVTDRIDTFTPTGIRLASGEELQADIIVTATGLNLVREHLELQGLRLLRRAQPGLVVRLHQRLLDAALRSHRRVRLPAAEPHGRDRHRSVHATPTFLRRRHARSTVDRELLRRLHAAGDGSLPQTGRPRTVDQPTELRPRQEDVRHRTGGRRRDAVHPRTRPSLSL
jgi:hypothetical protein